MSNRSNVMVISTKKYSKLRQQLGKLLDWDNAGLVELRQGSHRLEAVLFNGIQIVSAHNANIFINAVLKGSKNVK